jgi:hypothetical protein
MKPRHADLFASDLDEATLIRSIDRLLMFYIRTADRLQRTSTWMDNLEGGVDYLREVILEDSLGIGEELEQEMARVVESYQCEWQTTLNDPQRLALFRSYVNSDEPDESVQRQTLRGQPQLAPSRRRANRRCRPARGRPFAISTPFRSRRGLARGSASGRLRCSALATRCMPSITSNRAARPTFCRAACLAMRAANRS